MVADPRTDLVRALLSQQYVPIPYTPSWKPERGENVPCARHLIKIRGQMVPMYDLNGFDLSLFQEGDFLVTDYDKGRGEFIYGTVTTIVGTNDLHLSMVRENDGRPLSYSWHVSSSSMNANERLVGCMNRDLFIGISNTKTASKTERGFSPGMKIDEYIDHLLEVSRDSEVLKALNTYKRCVLPKRVKDMIEEALVMVLRSNVFDEWGFNDTFEKGLTNSILIWGPPGTGKTMICGTIAAVLGKNILKLDSGVLQSQIPGQVERNIVDNFQNAANNNAIILFDECDSVLYNRDMVGAVMSAEINCLLREIENFKGVCLFTTNRLGRLDPAMQRRIIAKIELPLPDKLAREAIWKNLIPKKMPLEDDIDYPKLASYDISGGEIKNAIILGARKAVLKNADKVSMADLLSGAKKVTKAKLLYQESSSPVTMIPEGVRYEKHRAGA